jgi:hypothetical protein
VDIAVTSEGSDQVLAAVTIFRGSR